MARGCHAGTEQSRDDLYGAFKGTPVLKDHPSSGVPHSFEC